MCHVDKVCRYVFVCVYNLEKNIPFIVCEKVKSPTPINLIFNFDRYIDTMRPTGTFDSRCFHEKNLSFWISKKKHFWAFQNQIDDPLPPRKYPSSIDNQ